MLKKNYKNGNRNFETNLRNYLFTISITENVSIIGIPKLQHIIKSCEIYVGSGEGMRMQAVKI